MSVERWIFHEGVRLGNSTTINDYLDVLSQRVLQVMPRAELTMFYTNLQLMGGYMAVQAKKRWQQVVKNCNFAQTTSSSYSTRNKYESYLLAKANEFGCACLLLLRVVFLQGEWILCSLAHSDLPVVSERHSKSCVCLNLVAKRRSTTFCGPSWAAPRR